ncbi:hypothetical protein PAXRUDRAFT_206469 [Paxillus rubicundulus Ve08.2h10]|uniref:Uncharacterized protein n=1 Tax=Paxillus rubicundulus Ve08.2h10 TaxID=930991 RepID=A0A0D0CEC5_9AGAM|nr:hypothetical protein PAXRUDRAFT_206469 [Paxillus rubicundulus Ve08.2h10]
MAMKLATLRKSNKAVEVELWPSWWLFQQSHLRSPVSETQCLFSFFLSRSLTVECFRVAKSKLGTEETYGRKYNGDNKTLRRLPTCPQINFTGNDFASRNHQVFLSDKDTKSVRRPFKNEIFLNFQCLADSSHHRIMRYAPRFKLLHNQMLVT